MASPYAACKSLIVGSARIVLPDFFSASRISYRLCRFSQNSALIPKKCASRSAVSPGMESHVKGTASAVP